MSRKVSDKDKSIYSKVEAAQAAREESYREQEEQEMEEQMIKTVK
jgi:hypothetical protein